MNNKYLIALAALALVALLSVGCNPTLSPTTETSPLATPGGTQSSPLVTPTAATSDVPPEAQAVVDQAIEDLAQRLDASPAAITVVSVKAIEWPDASLGCPKRGVMYIQVITPGYQVILESGGQQYDYHTGGEQIVLCEPSTGSAEPTAPVIVPTPDPTAAPLVEMAKQNLAKQLNVGIETITLVSATAVQWRDSSLGCPQPGTGYLTVITPGYLIKLEAGGQVYEYHSSRTEVVTCKNPQAPLGPE